MTVKRMKLTLIIRFFLYFLCSFGLGPSTAFADKFETAELLQPDDEVILQALASDGSIGMVSF